MFSESTKLTSDFLATAKSEEPYQNHSKYEKFHKSTIYRIIGRAVNESGNERASGGDRMANVMATKNIQLLKVMFDHEDGVLQR